MEELCVHDHRLSQQQHQATFFFDSDLTPITYSNYPGPMHYEDTHIPHARTYVPPA